MAQTHERAGSNPAESTDEVKKCPECGFTMTLHWESYTVGDHYSHFATMEEWYKCLRCGYETQHEYPY